MHVNFFFPFPWDTGNTQRAQLKDDDSAAHLFGFLFPFTFVFLPASALISFQSFPFYFLSKMSLLHAVFCLNEDRRRGSDGVDDVTKWRRRSILSSTASTRE